MSEAFEEGYYVRVLSCQGRIAQVENAVGIVFPLQLPRGLRDVEPGVALQLLAGQATLADESLWPSRGRVLRVVFVDGDLAFSNQATAPFALKDTAGLDVAAGALVRINPLAEIVAIIDEGEAKGNEAKSDSQSEEFAAHAESLLETESSGLTWSDFGGSPDLVADARELVELHLLQAGTLTGMGGKPTRGVIFEGPPGTGKTFLGKIMASEAEAKIFVISGPSLVGKYVGESEGRLNALYEAAAKHAPAIVFIDELDSIASSRGPQSHDYADRLVAALLVNMDGFKSHERVLTIGTTNQVDEIDPALRRPGRFSYSLHFDAGNEEGRVAVLTALARRHALVQDLPLAEVAARTPDWTPAQLEELFTIAAVRALRARRSKIAAVDLLSAVQFATGRRQDGTK